MGVSAGRKASVTDGVGWLASAVELAELPAEGTLPDRLAESLERCRTIYRAAG